MDRARISGVCCLHVSSKPVVSSPVPWKIRRLKIQPNSTAADLFLSVWLKACCLVKLTLRFDWIENLRTHFSEWCPAEPYCTADIPPAAKQESCNITVMSVILKNHDAKYVYWSEIDLLDECKRITEESILEMCCWCFL